MAWSSEWKDKPIKADMDLEEFKKQFKMLEEAFMLPKEAWPVGTGSKIIKPEDVIIIGQQENKTATEINAAWQNDQNDLLNKLELKGDFIVTETKIENGEIVIKDITEEYNNLKPTHDPYTNPNAFLYYECKCGVRLDPHTKSFAHLNNAASLAGWKIRWSSDSYVPYCPKCGEEVE